MIPLQMNPLILVSKVYAHSVLTYLVYYRSFEHCVDMKKVVLLLKDWFLPFSMIMGHPLFHVCHNCKAKQLYWGDIKFWDILINYEPLDHYYFVWQVLSNSQETLLDDACLHINWYLFEHRASLFSCLL